MCLVGPDDECSMDCPSRNLTVDLWLELGHMRGWCSSPVCDTHEGLPYTPDESDRLEVGDPACVYAVRLYRPGTITARLPEEAS
jgi:hypothetical protein